MIDNASIKIITKRIVAFEYYNISIKADKI
jgi:hypothetical protein